MNKTQAKKYILNNRFTVKEARKLIADADDNGMSTIDRCMTKTRIKKLRLEQLNNINDDFDLKQVYGTRLLAISILRDFKNF